MGVGWGAWRPTAGRPALRAAGRTRDMRGADVTVLGEPDFMDFYVCTHMSRIDTLVIASNNPGKLAELQLLLGPAGLKLIAQSALGIAAADEPYGTFVENALAKARHVSRQSGLAALADDAGICVRALQEGPGVNTAHYAQQSGFAAHEHARAMLHALRDIAPGQRQARMVSVLVALRCAQDPEPLIAVGSVAGAIALAPSGTGGFGYDPIFVLPELGKTLAQLSVADKNMRSHRGLAVQRMLSLLQTQWLIPPHSFALGPYQK